ncbi:TPA: recombinase family protein [Pseudomonas aeruginosa]
MDHDRIARGKAKRGEISGERGAGHEGVGGGGHCGEATRIEGRRRRLARAAGRNRARRPAWNKLLSEANQGDTLLVESIDRLSRLTQRDFQELKRRIQEKGLRLVVADLPTTYQMIQTSDSITHSILELINNMLIDLLATMARLDNEKRIERIKQGLARSGYKPTGKKANEAKHKRIKVGNMTKEEIAKAVNCGVATVYRVAKVI